jgi:N-hydroxyarylamine O-acetyltransferase
MERLGFSASPAADLAGLNALYAAWCGRVPFDNVQKRIWIAGDRKSPLTGGEPAEFFGNWLAHGTGGTCWPLAAGMYALLDSAGFDVRRIAGSMIDDSYEAGANHGTVLVTLEGTDYLPDPSIGSFGPLRLAPGEASAVDSGIHAIRAEPVEWGFEVLWHPGSRRKEPLPFRTEPAHDPVGHAFFLGRYDRSLGVGHFNSALYISRRFRDSIITVWRYKKTVVAADGSVTAAEILDADRAASLVDEFGLSEEIVRALPPDADR